MSGLVSEPDTTIIMDEWLLYVQGTIQRLVDVTVPEDLLLNAWGAIVPWTLAPTRANALSMLRAHACASKVVGHSSLATPGFEVPRRTELKETLEHGLEPLVLQDASTSIRLHWLEVSLVHMINMMWEPLLRYIEALVDGRPAQWSSTLSNHAQILILEMQGRVSEPDTPLIMDDWRVYVQDTLKRLVDVTVPLDVLGRSLGIHRAFDIGTYSCKCLEHAANALLFLVVGVSR